MNRRVVVVSAVVLGAAVIAAGASGANFRSVDDPRGDTKCLHRDTLSRRPCSDSRRRNADAVRATAQNEGWGLRPTIRVVGAERGGGFVGRCMPGSGSAAVRSDFHLHSVEIFFSKRCIGNPRRYGWRASALAGPAQTQAVDFVPNGGGYIRH
jgi:hypothetical protein